MLGHPVGVVGGVIHHGRLPRAGDITRQPLIENHAHKERVGIYQTVFFHQPCRKQVGLLIHKEESAHVGLKKAQGGSQQLGQNIAHGRASRKLAQHAVDRVEQTYSLTICR